MLGVKSGRRDEIRDNVASEERGAPCSSTAQIMILPAAAPEAPSSFQLLPFRPSRLCALTYSSCLKPHVCFGFRVYEKGSLVLRAQSLRSSDWEADQARLVAHAAPCLCADHEVYLIAEIASSWCAQPRGCWTALPVARGGAS